MNVDPEVDLSGTKSLHFRSTSDPLRSSGALAASPGLVRVAVSNFSQLPTRLPCRVWRLPTMAQHSVIDVAGTKYLGADVTVLFLGFHAISGTDSKLVAMSKQSITCDPIKVTETCTAEKIIQKAAQERFNKPDLDVAEANVYITEGK